MNGKYPRTIYNINSQDYYHGIKHFLSIRDKNGKTKKKHPPKENNSPPSVNISLQNNYLQFPFYIKLLHIYKSFYFCLFM